MKDNYDDHKPQSVRVELPNKQNRLDEILKQYLKDFDGTVENPRAQAKTAIEEWVREIIPEVHYSNKQFADPQSASFTDGWNQCRKIMLNNLEQRQRLEGQDD